MFSITGKTMENLRSRINFHLVQTPERAIKKASSPTFDHFTIFNNDLVGIHCRQKTLTLNRPIYTGFAVLELSKLLMYRFHYDIIRAQYGDSAKLLFTDTDSLTYDIQTDDLYQDFAERKEHYDFSGYPRDHPLYTDENKKVLGKFKDELDGTLIEEFCGLRPKMYSILSTKGEKKTAKGICRRVVKKNVRHYQYRECLFKHKLTMEGMKRIVSKKHELFTIHQTKLCLNPCDDKRYIIDGFTTLAHGHFKIPKE